MSDFHRASPKTAWLRLCRIKNELTETKKCYSSLNRELPWLHVFDISDIHKLVFVLDYKSTHEGMPS